MYYLFSLSNISHVELEGLECEATRGLFKLGRDLTIKIAKSLTGSANNAMAAQYIIATGKNSGPNGTGPEYVRQTQSGVNEIKDKIDVSPAIGIADITAKAPNNRPTRNCLMKKKAIKQRIEFNGLTIDLYQHVRVPGNLEHVSNIEAFDDAGSLLWKAEPPTHSFSYYDMQIDEEKKILWVSGGDAHYYEIDLSTGRILSNRIIK